jgi:hypothetical protein
MSLHRYQVGEEIAIHPHAYRTVFRNAVLIAASPYPALMPAVTTSMSKS